MNAFGIERRHDRLQIVAHQIKLVLIVFIALQRYYMQGLLAGSVKG